MIETTYVRLEKAAEMLGADSDTLLIAAIEARLQLWGLIAGGPDGAIIANALMMPEEEKDEWEPTKEDFCDAPITPGFYKIDPYDLPNLLVNGYCHITHISIGHWYFDFLHTDQNCPKVERQNIYMRADDVKKIRADAAIPEPNTVPSHKRTAAATKTYNTQHRIIGGLLHMILKGLDEDSNKISTYISQEQIIGYLDDKFKLVYGLRKTNLETVFADANRALHEAQNHN